MDYRGVIIEESLEDKSVLNDVNILSTEIEKTTSDHHSSVPQWTLHAVEVSEDKADEVAKVIARSLVSNEHWYADFKNATHHYIIFKNKVFFVDRYSKEQYDEAKRYGIALGIPKHQVDFHPDVKKWER